MSRVKSQDAEDVASAFWRAFPFCILHFAFCIFSTSTQKNHEKIVRRGRSLMKHFFKPLLGDRGTKTFYSFTAVPTGILYQGEGVE